MKTRGGAAFARNDVNKLYLAARGDGCKCHAVGVGGWGL